GAYRLQDVPQFQRNADATQGQRATQGPRRVTPSSRALWFDLLDFLSELRSVVTVKKTLAKRPASLELAHRHTLSLLLLQYGDQIQTTEQEDFMFGVLAWRLNTP